MAGDPRVNARNSGSRPQFRGRATGNPERVKDRAIRGRVRGSGGGDNAVNRRKRAQSAALREAQKRTR